MFAGLEPRLSGAFWIAVSSSTFEDSPLAKFCSARHPTRKMKAAVSVE